MENAHMAILKQDTSHWNRHATSPVVVSAEITQDGTRVNVARASHIIGGHDVTLVSRTVDDGVLGVGLDAMDKFFEANPSGSAKEGLRVAYMAMVNRQYIEYDADRRQLFQRLK